MHSIIFQLVSNFATASVTSIFIQTIMRAVAIVIETFIVVYIQNTEQIKIKKNKFVEGGSEHSFNTT